MAASGGTVATCFAQAKFCNTLTEDMKTSSAYVTQRHVAKRAGVHQTTVSLVLRNHPSVPEATRERVLAAVKQLGYKRHPFLAALMSSRMRLTSGMGNSILAFLTDFDSRDRWKESPTAVEMFDGARQRAQELGFRLEVHWLNDPKLTPRRLAEILKARNIHGLLLAPTHEPHGFFKFDFTAFSVVGLGVSSEASSLLSVSHDHFNGMRRALAQCAATGYRRVGIALTMDANQFVRDKWLAAYSLDTSAGDKLVRIPVWQPQAFEARNFVAWLRKNRVEVIVGTFDDKFPRVLATMGYDIPRDLALVSLSLT
ncbi:MAG TPA: LacI family DNA-binding transcriptional regulator, partial [Opitutaceae bacterium]|nr:LacI family DNA-binding transcriptional regulator [Opitutaceae bacterium]